MIAQLPNLSRRSRPAFFEALLLWCLSQTFFFFFFFDTVVDSNTTGLSVLRLHVRKPKYTLKQSYYIPVQRLLHTVKEAGPLNHLNYYHHHQHQLLYLLISWYKHAHARGFIATTHNKFLPLLLLLLIIIIITPKKSCYYLFREGRIFNTCKHQTETPSSPSLVIPKQFPPPWSSLLLTFYFSLFLSLLLSHFSHIMRSSPKYTICNDMSITVFCLCHPSHQIPNHGYTISSMYYTY